MKLTVVGCAPAYTRRSGNASSSYLVEHGNTRVVMDMGQGSFAEMWRYGSFGDISAVAISHLHADHNVDLIPLRHWVRYQNNANGPALYSPSELRMRIGEYQADPDFLSDLQGESLSPSTFAVGDLALQAAPVTHIPDSYAFRVWDPSDPAAPGLVYSGDCGRADDLLPLVRRGDTLLCEAAFAAQQSDPFGIHLTANDAARVAREAGAERLILTHILDREDRDAALVIARDAVSVNVELAEPGLTVDIR